MKTGPWEKEELCTDCVAENHPVFFRLIGDRSNAAPDPGFWYRPLCEGGGCINDRVISEGREKNVRITAE